MSRKSKSYRAWLHAVGGGTLEDAFFAGWAAQKGLAHARSIQSLRAEVEALKNVLEFYADPDTYFAISFFADNRAGEFLDDFSEDKYTDDYGRPMPGKRARAALRGEVEK